MTASDGMSTVSRRVGASDTCANMPGRSRRSGLRNSARTVRVRLWACALGRIAVIRPANFSPGKAVSVALSGCPTRTSPARIRSEEHTSELQSLMRISYAVFCLKNKNNQYHTLNTNNETDMHKKSNYI